MPMIVREMILLDNLHFDSFRKPDEHSGWLGPPSSVPFAWEQAPGTPKQSSTPVVPSSPTTSTSDVLCSSASQPQEPTPLELALVKVDSLRTESFEPRNSIHILETAPRALLLEATGNEVPWNALMSFRKGSVPFKWEMEPGIARDPDKCREFLNCPLTPPPVLHSRSVIVESSRRARSSRQLSVSDRMRSFFHRPVSPAAGGPKKKGLSKAASSKSRSENSEDEDLSPVSVLDFSVRRLSSASSATSYYHTPKGSFSWDSGQDLASSTRSSFKSPRRSTRDLPSPVKKNGFGSMFMQLQHKKQQQQQQQQNGGCLMMLTGDSRVGSCNSYELASSSSEKSSATSSSLSSSSMASLSEHHHQQDEDSKHQLQNIESEEEDDAQSAYYTPAMSRLQSPAPFHKPEEEKNHLQLQLVERVESLDSVDPGFAPSDSGDEDLVLCRIASFAHWQRRQGSKKSKRSQLAKNILGVIVCCYVPGECR